MSIHRHFFYRSVVLICLAWALASCLGAEQEVPLESIDFLHGNWIQTDGHTQLQFYRDDNLSIKFTNPSTHPPTRFLSSLEPMKDGLAFSLGNRWEGPVEIILLDQHDRIDLVMPGDKPRQVLHMKRVVSTKEPSPR